MDERLAEGRIEAIRRTVDSRLAVLVPDPGEAPHRLHAAMNYALLTPGKRLRPILTILAAEALGGDLNAALDPACAVEMVHAASLVLDDLPCMDNAIERRGQPTTFRRYGEDVAILAAVGLLNHAFLVLANCSHLDPAATTRMVRALSNAVGLDGLVAGQDGDLRRERELSISGLTEINRLKTAVLFEAAVELGALTAKAGRREVDALRSFAGELGLSFQTLDDVSDLGEDKEPTLAATLGLEGARNEAVRRLAAARRSLRDQSDGLARFDDSMDMLVSRIMVG